MLILQEKIAIANVTCNPYKLLVKTNLFKLGVKKFTRNFQNIFNPPVCIPVTISILTGINIISGKTANIGFDKVNSFTICYLYNKFKLSSFNFTLSKSNNTSPFFIPITLVNNLIKLGWWRLIMHVAGTE